MYQKRVQRMICLFLLAFLLVGLVGCKKDGKVVVNSETEKEEEKKDVAYGRYVEEEIVLPESIKEETILDFISGPDHVPMLLSKKEEGEQTEYKSYSLQKDFRWKEQPCEWLNELAKQKVSVYPNSITYSESGFYVVGSEIMPDEEQSRPRIYESKDGIEVTDISIADLDKKEQGYYILYPSRATRLKNGNLVFSTYGGVQIYNGDNKIIEIQAQNQFFTTKEDTIYIIDGASGAVTCYDGNTGNKINENKIDIKEFYGASVAVGDSGDICTLSSEGIQVLKNGSGVWEIVVDGDRNTMGSKRYHQRGFLEGDAQDYLVYYESMDESKKFARYVYDDTVPVEPEITLTVFALNENAAVHQAVNDFMSKNPSIGIDYEPILEENLGAGREDIIRNLNTELLSGKGPDIIILDGLREETYIEKGVLADLTELTQQLVSSGDLLKNVADAFTTEGKVYSLPTKTGIPLLFGRASVLEEVTDLKSIAEIASSREKGEVFGNVDQRALLNIFYNVYSDTFLEKQEIKEEKLTEFLQNVKTIFDSSNLADGENIWPSNATRLLDTGTLLYPVIVNGFFNSENYFSIIGHMEGEFQLDFIPLTDSFVSYGIIGINEASKNKEYALQFLQCALSEENQRPDFYDGFTVNQNALEYLCSTEIHTADAYGGTIDGIDGKTYPYEFFWPKKEILVKLEQIYKSASKQCPKDETIRDIFWEETEGYFAGKRSLEETVNAVMTKFHLYLEE